MFMESLYFNENQIKNLNIIGKGCEGKVVKLNNNSLVVPFQSLMLLNLIYIILNLLILILNI